MITNNRLSEQIFHIRGPAHKCVECHLENSLLEHVMFNILMMYHPSIKNVWIIFIILILLSNTLNVNLLNVM